LVNFSGQYHPAFKKFGFIFVECDDCKTVYINPRPTPKILDDYYSTSKNYWYWNKFIFPASEDARREKIFRPRVEQVLSLCRKYNVKTGTLLEVGAGFGTFCEELSKTGTFSKIIAIEPTPDLAETCRKKGVQVIEKPVEKVRLDNETIDVIVSFEVIEHLFSPRDFIGHCASLLAPGGILVLSCPNIEGFDITVLKEKSDSIDVEHLNYFTPSSLSHLVSSFGFTILEISTPGKLDAEIVRKKAVSGEFSLKNQPFLQRLLIDKWEATGSAFQQFLADNNLSSHLWLIGRKQ
jgi:2-polyprenyl-3-methyl-5-hydroxy-6-metoxy-1,4-benzoquinol methylase